MSRNRHKNKNLSNHPKPKKTLIDERSSYSPNSIGGRIDLESLREKLFCQEVTNQNTINKPTENAEYSEESLQAKGEEK